MLTILKITLTLINKNIITLKMRFQLGIPQLPHLWFQGLLNTQTTILERLDASKSIIMLNTLV